MKIEFINTENFICYINKYFYKFEKETINNFIFKIIKLLKKKYSIDMYAIFDVTCHIDNSYGIVLEISRKIDAFSKYLKKSNINVECIEEEFLFELDDYFITNKRKYKYAGKYYIKSSDIDYIIIEHVNKILYGDKIMI